MLTHETRCIRWLVCLTAALMFWPAASWGQGTGATRGDRGKLRGGGGPAGGVPMGRGASQQGVATVLKFTAAERQDTEEGFVGTLRLRMEDGRSVSLEVPAEAVIRLGDREFTSEEMGEILTSGIQLNVGWETEKKKRGEDQVLKSANFHITDVVGEVTKVDAKTEVATVRVVPTGGKLWPDQEARYNKAKSMAQGREVRPPKPQKRSLQIKAVDDASAVLDIDKVATTLLDLEPGTRIEGQIVMGKPFGLVSRLEVRPKKGEEQEAGQQADEGGGEPIRPAGGGGGGTRGGGGKPPKLGG